ncbi:MAG TPA: SOS response-associated peptidase [Capsulimonadaceae bacterium]|jgi:putative SOS response-associated peptidase YedK
MCARYTLYHSTSEIVARFEVQSVLFDVAPRYNIAPTDTIPVIIDGTDRRLDGFRWGLVPFWAKDTSVGNKMLNARAETLIEKPAFKKALEYRRCIIPADGFYEWTGTPKDRQPLHIQFTDAPLFGFAGLYEKWEKPDGELLYSTTIITVPANSMMADFHDRMPAILHPDDEAMWLDHEFRNVDAAVSALRPFEADAMRAYRVDKQVNRAGVEGAECILPLATQGEMAI